MNGIYERERLEIEHLRTRVKRYLDLPGWRYGHMTARPLNPEERDALTIEVLLLDASAGGGVVLSAPLPKGTLEFPSLTPSLPAAHWAERAIGDLFGLKAAGHPRWKSLIFHDLSSRDLHPLNPSYESHEKDDDDPKNEERPYEFLTVQGEGSHEIPVGPIHAGIIEPGHFRFSCVGEVIVNLEIRLGYQYRGAERRLTEIPWRKAHYAAEAASSDTSAGNGLAHAVAIERLLEVEVPRQAQVLRAMSLEIERIANHLGDIGGLSADIGYSAGAAIFARLRGNALSLGELLSGSRFQRGFIVPGGVKRALNGSHRVEFARGLTVLRRNIVESLPVVLENPSVIERMEGIGRLSPSLAREFGLTGPAARASGSDYDARNDFSHAIYPWKRFHAVRRESGDVLARAQMRGEEIMVSVDLLSDFLAEVDDSELRESIGDRLPPNRIGIGVVEAWRGELIHWITTDADGSILRYAIKDPSFTNWTGLAIAARGNLVGDFPLCNKSFNLSYSGNDL